MFPFFFFDPTMVLLIPALVFAMYAQSLVRSTFQKFLRVQARTSLSGAQVARDLLDRNGLTHVRIEQTPRSLGDHYDPRAKVVRLSPEVYSGRSLAALGVAAHETGHAVQHAGGYFFLQFRNNLFPVASIGSQAAFPLFILGLFMGLEILMTVGIWFFVVALAFQVVTLPVEFDASRRAIAMMVREGYLANASEEKGARKVLNAAALTYVASAAVAASQLIRLLVLRNARRR